MSEELDLAALQPREVPATVTKTLENYLKSRGDDVASVDAVYTCLLYTSDAADDSTEV